MKHSPEPWACAKTYTFPHGRPEKRFPALNIHGGKPQPGFAGNIVACLAPEPYITEQDVLNGERIVSCVNACAGIEDPTELPRAMRALWHLVDALGAHNRPHELEGYGITHAEAVEICRLAELGGAKE